MRRTEAEKVKLSDLRDPESLKDRTKDGKTQLQGGADPRREGIVLGDGSL